MERATGKAYCLEKGGFTKRELRDNRLCRATAGAVNCWIIESRVQKRVAKLADAGAMYEKQKEEKKAASSSAQAKGGCQGISFTK